MTDSIESTPVAERATIYNEGVNGFHILTIVTDGYGNLIAEDQYGNHLAMVKHPYDEAVGEDANNAAVAESVKALTLEAFETFAAHARAGVKRSQVALDRRTDRAKLRAEVQAKIAAASSGS